MFSLFHVLFFFLLAGRAIAFTTLELKTTNLTVTEIVNIPDSPVKVVCTTNCTTATSVITTCNGDPQCLCRQDTVAILLACEQCMLTELIRTNKPMPDFRAGSVPVLGAYSSACNTSGLPLEATQIALTLPPFWDGPFVAILPLPAVIITVAMGSFLGVSALLILSNM